MSNKKERKVFTMRLCKIKKKAMRSVRIREVKLRIRAKKQAKLQSSGKETEKARMKRIDQILSKIRQEKRV